MASIKQLLVRLNQTVRANMGNALFALFLTLICETVLGMIFVAPATMIVTRSTSTLNDMIFAGILLFCALVIWLLFQYGFHVLILRMTRRQYVTIGYVFYGFKKFKQTIPHILTLAVMVVALTLAFSTGSRVVMSKLNEKKAISAELTTDNTTLTAPKTDFSAASAENPKADADSSSKESDDENLLSSDRANLLNDILKQTGILLAVYLLLVVIVFIRFSFVFYLHFDNPSANAFFLLKKSAMLMHKNALRLIALIIRAGGHNLIVAVAAFFLTLAISATNKDGSRSGLSIAVLLFNFIYFVNAYTALLRMYFAFPVMYTDALLAKIDIIVKTQDTIVLEETAAFLASKFPYQPDDAEDSPTESTESAEETATGTEEQNPQKSSEDSISPDSEN
ncbi:MAG: hypothetical protein IJP62_05980 [Treponema sp.]|nr:hypothetical protein [Treponema sp.]